VIVQDNLTESRAQVNRALDLNSNVVGWIKVWTWFVGALLGVSGYLFFKDKKLSELIRKAKENVKSISQMRDEARQKMDEFRLSFPTLKIDKDWDAEDHPSNEKIREVLMQFIVFETFGGKLSAGDLINRAKAYYFLGEYQSALDIVEQALKLDFNNAASWTMKGIMLFKFNHFDKALTSFEQALKLNSDDVTIWNNKGATLERLNRLDEALSTFEHTLKLKPDYAEALHNKGIALGKLGRHSEALTSFEQAIIFRPNYAEAMRNKGVVLGIMNRYEEALTALEQAISYKPDFHEAWSDMGVVLAELNRYDEALVAYEYALRVKYSFADAWFNMACLYSLRKDKSNALPVLKKAILHNPECRAKARIDKDFEWLWNDLDFIAIVGKDNGGNDGGEKAAS
jgi:tetratricopeptide (TPR) repeat protein